MSELNDPRVLFAAERTLLAWSRTAAGLIALGFLIERAGLIVRGTAAGRDLGFWIGLAFVLLGVALSIFLLLGRASRPRVVELGRVPKTSFFADLIRHPENERVADVLVVRSVGSLVYFNVDHVRDRISALVNEQSAPPHLVVLFMGNVPGVDLAGAEMLVDLERTFGRQGISFRLAEVHGPVREALRRLEPSHRSDLAEANQTVDDVLVKWRANPR